MKRETRGYYIGPLGGGGTMFLVDMKEGLPPLRAEVTVSWDDPDSHTCADGKMPEGAKINRYLSVSGDPSWVVKNGGLGMTISHCPFCGEALK